MYASVHPSGHYADFTFPNGGDSGPDARLIAAAPDLLAALTQIAAIEDKLMGCDWEEIEEARAIARAAIAKATGSTS